ncbi:arabinose operon transcriptional regulator AraC [Vibrio sp. WXL103]|uniref:arabinose operon transcriptional regulator AraC n=1 Tax=Vibrio sp. WXL103 TaxID=3450710 RepID=UPI003EC8A692
MSPKSPPLPDYNYDINLVAGDTIIEDGNIFDYIVNRPNGMRGYVLHLTTLGKGKIFEGDGEFIVKEAELLLFPPSVVHFYQREESSPSWHHKWIYFRPRGFWGTLLDWDTKRMGVGHLPIKNKDVYTKMHKLFEEVELFSKTDAPFSEELALNRLEEILLRCKVLNPSIEVEHIDHRIKTVKTLIMDDIQSDISTEELANAVYLSPSRLAHLFKNEMKMTITQWREKQRIEYAKQLLFSSQMPVSMISYNVGFNDPLYFSKVFKRITGVSPTQYRNR